MPRRRRSESHINAFRQSRAGCDDLYQVVTISEAARLWAKHPTSVRRQINSGRLCARKGDLYLISVASLRNLWGDPVKPMRETLDI